jgi:hypothetical protein
LTNADLAIRIYAPGATGGDLNLYFVGGTAAGGGVGLLPLEDYADGWVEYTWNVGGAVGNFDPSALRELYVQFEGGDWGPDPLVVYIDAIRTLSGPVYNHTFDMEDQTLPTMGGTMSISTCCPELTIDGSELGWAEFLP